MPFRSSRYTEPFPHRGRQGVAVPMLWRWVQSFNVFRALDGHSGCVNSIEFNEEGTLLITGSDDLTFCIYDTTDWRLLCKANTCHSANLFSCVFVPCSGNSKVVSCGLDGATSLTDVLDGSSAKLHQIRGDIASRIIFSALSPQVPFVAHGDGAITSLDIRSPHNTTRRMYVDSDVTTCSAICVSPQNPFVFAVGTNTPNVYLFDVRRLRESSLHADQPREDTFGSSAFLTLSNSQFRRSSALFPGRSGLHDGIGGLNFSSDGSSLVASYKNNDVFVFEFSDALRFSARMQWSIDDGFLWQYENDDRLGQDVSSRTFVYKGRQNRQTMFKEAVFFHDDMFIATGGDDGKLYFWDRTSGELIHKIRADCDIVNGVLVHPTLPVVVTCGIDNSAKVFRSTGNVNSAATDTIDMFGQPHFPFPSALHAWLSDEIEEASDLQPNLQVEEVEEESSDNSDDLPDVQRVNFFRQVLITFGSRQPPTLTNLRSLEAQLANLFRARLEHSFLTASSTSDDESEEIEGGQDNFDQEVDADLEGAETQDVTTLEGSRHASERKNEESTSGNEEEASAFPPGESEIELHATIGSMLQTLKPFLDELKRVAAGCIRRRVLTNDWTTFPFRFADRSGSGVRTELKRLTSICNICLHGLKDVATSDSAEQLAKTVRMGQLLMVLTAVSMSFGCASAALKYNQQLLCLISDVPSDEICSDELFQLFAVLKVKALGLRVRILHCSKESPSYLDTSISELRSFLSQIDAEQQGLPKAATKEKLRKKEDESTSSSLRLPNTGERNTLHGAVARAKTLLNSVQNEE